MVEQHQQKKGPFSPLQTGCAFLMLTNMLIYLGVIAFVFNMLDPSKLDRDYLAKRGFTTQNKERESREDQEFRRLTEAKEKEQQEFIDSLISEAAQSPAKEISAAQELSKRNKRSLATSRPNEESRRSALLQTPDPFFSKLNKISPAKTQLHPLYLKPMITRQTTYVPYRLPEAVSPLEDLDDRFDVELNAGIGYPVFSIPISQKTSRATSTPPEEAPPATPDAAKDASITNDTSPIRSGAPENGGIP